MFLGQMVVVDVPTAVHRPEMRLTIDYPECLVLCRGVYDAPADVAPRIPMTGIIEFLYSTPALVDLVNPYAQSVRPYSK
jgi:spore coat polysaccharide biosynthesis protein SpsF (cytidylyltransferase family)